MQDLYFTHLIELLTDDRMYHYPIDEGCVWDYNANDVLLNFDFFLLKINVLYIFQIVLMC
jgi:hypothetical protein